MLTSSSSGALIRRVGHEEAFRLFKEAGLDAMDYPVDGGVYCEEALKAANAYGLPEREVIDKFSRIKEIADRYGIVIGQTHAAFGNFEMSDRQDFFEVLVGDIAATAALGCHVTVIHPVRIPGRIRDAKREEGLAYNLEFYRRLAPVAGRYGVKIAIENTFDADSEGRICASECSDPTELRDLIDTLGTDRFCACVDTGHFSLTERDTGYTVGDCIRVLGSRTEVIHVQETDRVTDFHTVPYTFKDTMDWEDIYSALREAGFSGPMNLEVMPHLSKYPDCPQMNFEAIRHIGAIARYVACRVCGE